MSRHTTYRGVTIDMDSIRRENEKTPALGNMSVNAKGDLITRGGTVIKSADKMARAGHDVKVSVQHGGLKGPLEEATSEATEVVRTPVKATIKKVKEVELPSGDIIIGGNENAS